MSRKNNTPDYEAFEFKKTVDRNLLYVNFYERFKEYVRNSGSDDSDDLTIEQIYQMALDKYTLPDFSAPFIEHPTTPLAFLLKDGFVYDTNAVEYYLRFFSTILVYFFEHERTSTSFNEYQNYKGYEIGHIPQFFNSDVVKMLQKALDTPSKISYALEDKGKPIMPQTTFKDMVEKTQKLVMLQFDPERADHLEIFYDIIGIYLDTGKFGDVIDLWKDAEYNPRIQQYNDSFDNGFRRMIIKKTGWSIWKAAISKIRGRQSFQDYVLNVLQQKKVPRERIWKLVEKYPENFPEFYDRVIETGDTEIARLATATLDLEEHSDPITQKIVEPKLANWRTIKRKLNVMSRYKFATVGIY